MFLVFEDWSQFNSLIPEGLPKSGKVVKVYASETHPSEIYRRSNMFIVESDGSVFREDELFPYENRQTWTGRNLNHYLERSGLSPQTQAVARALFRFDNLPETQFCQDAMKAKKPDGTWLIDHPMQDLDFGIYRTPESTHLDIFFPESIQRLFALINLEANPHALISGAESFALAKSIRLPPRSRL